MYYENTDKVPINSTWKYQGRLCRRGDVWLSREVRFTRQREKEKDGGVGGVGSQKKTEEREGRRKEGRQKRREGGRN